MKGCANQDIQVIPSGKYERNSKKLMEKEHETKVAGNSLADKKFEIHSIFSKLHDVALQSGLNLPVPEIVFVGDQTVGKSSVVEAFIGLKFNYVKKRIATRRPLRLRCERREIPEPEWTDLKTHRTMSTREAEEFIAKENENLAESKNFIDCNPLELLLHAPSCWNITILDLPGLRANDVEGEEGNAESIEEIVRKYLKEHADERLILFVESSRIEEFAKSTAFKFLRANAPMWADRTAVCMNMLDLCLADQVKPSPTNIPEEKGGLELEKLRKKTKGEIEAFLHDAGAFLGNGIPRFYTSLPSEKDVAAIDKSSEDGWIMLIRAKEESDKEKLKSYSVSEEFQPLVGFSRLANYLSERLNNKYLSILPQLTTRLTIMRKEGESELASLESALKGLEPDKLVFSATGAINAVVSQLNLLLSGGNKELFEKYALTYDEEYVLCLKEFPECKLEIPSMFDSALVYKDRRLLGGSQYRRLMEEVEVYLRCIDFGEIGEDLILNYYLKLHPDHDSTYWMDIVSKLALELTHNLLTPAIDKVIDRARFIMTRLFLISLETVENERYSEILLNSEFKKTLQGLFSKFLDNKLTFLGKSLMNYLDACAKTVHEWRPVSSNGLSDLHTALGSAATQMNLPAQTFARVMQAMGRDNCGNPLPKPPTLVFANSDYTPENINKARSQIHFYFSRVREKFSENIVLLFDAYCKNPMFDELRIDGLGASFSISDIEGLFCGDIPLIKKKIEKVKENLAAVESCAKSVSDIQRSADELELK